MRISEAFAWQARVASIAQPFAFRLRKQFFALVEPCCLNVTVMEHTKQLLSINLANLVPSHRNVRRHSTMQVEELAALIDAQGLLHNLVVTEQVVGRGKARKLKFAVAAGERRRRALLLLQQRGRLPKSHEVLCERVPSARALEVSVAENSGREALHPADEFSAGPEKQEMNQPRDGSRS